MHVARVVVHTVVGLMLVLIARVIVIVFVVAFPFLRVLMEVLGGRRHSCAMSELSRHLTDEKAAFRRAVRVKKLLYGLCFDFSADGTELCC